MTIDNVTTTMLGNKYKQTLREGLLYVKILHIHVTKQWVVRYTYIHTVTALFG